MTEPAARGLALSGAPLPVFAAAPSDPMGPSPERRPNSVRRTMSLEATWPSGKAGPAVFVGEARDILTVGRGDAPEVLDCARIDVTAEHRVVLAISADPPRPELAALVGARAGGHLRRAVDQALPAEKVAGSPLYLLLDDLAGATLVCDWSWGVWNRSWRESATPEALEQFLAKMTGVCIGFRPGSSALTLGRRSNSTVVKPLPNPADPQGWHRLEERAEINFRRARRMDVWRDGGLLHIDAGFQDSSSAPGGGDRIAVHEYRLRATAEDGRLRSVEVKPGTLPYKECPAALANVDELIGAPLRNLREIVLERLRKTAGCTHLNDMLRALAETPPLAEHLAALAV